MLLGAMRFANIDSQIPNISMILGLESETFFSPSQTSPSLNLGPFPDLHNIHLR
jgi:hypothetical protein